MINSHIEEVKAPAPPEEVRTNREIAAEGAV